MRVIDQMRPAMRMLIYEFGYAIVSAMMREGMHNPEKLLANLQYWRAARQAQWLDTDHVQYSRTPEQIFKDAERRSRWPADLRK